jgi:LmbE family N-acetylglucosaminyl deacetylase
MNSLARQLVLRAWRIVVPKQARNSLRLWLGLEIPDMAPRLIEDFSARRIVVLAPHMDDEIIGPGGTILRHLRAKAPVTFVFMTDGMAGEPNAAKTLSQLRKSESRKAAEMLGVSDLIFLDGPDGALDDSPEMVAVLSEVLRERRPSVIYAPALTDHHADHWATNRILRQALDRLPEEVSRDLLVRGYEVWTPLPANRLADITSVADLKRHAIEAFESQLQHVNYVWTIMGLNQYRSMVHLTGKGYAEAFFETTTAEYARYFEQVSLRAPFGAEDPQTPWD